MITKVNLKNFKRIESEDFTLSDFDLLVGSNNSGKSTLLQAMAIWQYCVDQFKRTKRKGSSGIQIVLPDFTALPLPEFNLLWKDKTERKNVKKDKGGNKPEFILIQITIYWQSVIDEAPVENYLTVQLRYASPLSIYAIPEGGFEKFKKLIEGKDFPQIIYVPPFSGLEPVEKWFDDGNIRQNVGKGQPGSVLRNLLYRVVDINDENGNPIEVTRNENWKEIENKINEWFGVKLNPPEYEKGQSTQITMNYTVGKKEFDIISAGSGFHQILTLMAFFYGYKEITTILFDEPDAHLHVNLQKQILSYFKQKRQIQFLIATHSEEFIRGVEVNSIVSILSGKPKRIQSSEEVVKAMSIVDNIDVVKTKLNPYILYVEGEDDERILTAWAETLGKSNVLKLFHIYKMGGTSKEEMKKRQDEHFRALRQINPSVQRFVIFDFDNEESYHPEKNNPAIIEWSRKNIENYLLVPDAWKRAVLDSLNQLDFDLFNKKFQDIIDDFFIEQNLTLPLGFNWSNVKANIFSAVDGKKILFEAKDSLFHRLKDIDSISLKVNREKVSSNMNKDLIHEDIVDFFNKLNRMIE
jgi:predicted ATPase